MTPDPCKLCGIVAADVRDLKAQHKELRETLTDALPHFEAALWVADHESQMTEEQRYYRDTLRALVGKEAP